MTIFTSFVDEYCSINKNYSMMWIIELLLVFHWTTVTSVLYPLVDFDKLYKYSPPENDVTFFIYSDDKLKEYQIIVDDDESLEKSGFDPKIPTKFIIHGWTHGKDVPWVKEMTEALTETRKWNVIVVDWAPLSHVIYLEGRLHTPVVSKQTAKMIEFLTRVAGIKPPSIHLIGHSMGAQISAYVGFKIHKAFGEKIGRITGLDPAAPLYEWPHLEYLDELLDPSDASFVDVIHTNARFLGMVTPAGHVDFYPNGGQIQPGCGFWDCSHLRAVEFFIASVRNPSLYQAYSYKSWDDYLEGETRGLQAYPMGMAASSSIPPGTYFLETHFEYRKYVDERTSIKDSFRVSNHPGYKFYALI